MSGRRRFVHIGGAALLALAFLGATSASHAESIRAGEWPLDSGHFRADEIWATSRGSGTTVAVVDSGVAADHPDLAGRVLPGVSLLGDGGDGRTDTSGDSHGTAIAGIIAAGGGPAPGDGMTGLAPEAKILPVRVGPGGQISASAVARGIVWAADHGAQVINISVGSPDPDPLLRQAVSYAMERDAVVVASAGNDGDRGNPAMYPAAFPGVVSVSGVDSAGVFWPSSESGPGIVVAAPAVGILSTNDQGSYVNADGTSYAAAYVSATAALIRSSHPELSAGQVIHRLITSTIERLDRPDAKLGYGRLDPLAALTGVQDAAGRENPLLRPRGAEPSASSFPTVPVAAVAAGSVLAVSAVVLVRLRWRRRPAPPAPARPRSAGGGGRNRGSQGTRRSERPRKSRRS
ncbi:type VII secretion-associated serine protease mycosin [Kitasatospora sp. A2-31]|uniref:type VII secretion-associated serine protease mycosin n=1 Tax=Kitasatospora sp. A2-31 TaxID=2916414 RepID=UPI001EEDDDF4|nr:type VII secretion-associated serine protease mycosin [Kitasatospora sp. A2-31]MCG6499940.1 type VII secretion-associated serine protease mycosin [Kitasatospora sp. A2-31]MCG6500114.1 type VII secretion-associated serine protease mycosin [Kitasatospora sp. A2-31]